MKLNEQPIHKLITLLDRDEITSVDIINDLYHAIEHKEDQVKAYLSLASQDELNSRIDPDHSGRLRNIPIAVKDIISTVDFITTCGSKFLKDFRPIYDATAIRRLKVEGALIMGKTNLDEFAMGSSTENSAFFDTHNPHDLERVPGGSSGGSTAAVAAGEAICALGTDTGGSIRLPAAFCGVVGFKPTYGLISRFGLVAYASSLDQIGPITRDVQDAAILLNVIAGRDLRDSTSIDRNTRDYTEGLGDGIEGCIMGVPNEYLEGLSEEAQAKVNTWVSTFKDLGAEIRQVSLPHTEYAIPTYYLIASSEASANLARFDGVRYTSRTSNRSVDEMFSESRDAGFGPEVKRRIMLGTYALSAGYYDQFYGKAQKVRTLIKQDFDAVFGQVDLLIAPVSPTPAFKLGEKIDDPLTMYLSDIYTIPVNLAGIPAISIPGGRVNGLPFGLQIIGDRLMERRILQAAYAFEQATQ
ncbi:MAG: Asp-tRNA(Asn)/Glu-tRNA(Gln) amidotransferase subunit GatA [Candidatus Bipolaricaulia bacterium]